MAKVNLILNRKLHTFNTVEPKNLRTKPPNCIVSNPVQKNAQNGTLARIEPSGAKDRGDINRFFNNSLSILQNPIKPNAYQYSEKRAYINKTTSRTRVCQIANTAAGGGGGGLKKNFFS